MNSAKKAAEVNTDIKPESISSIWGGAASVTTIWVLVILKEAYKPIDSVLNFYKPVGPLLGIFVVSLIVFWAVCSFRLSKIKELPPNKLAKELYNSLKWFIIASVLVLFMTFPPIYNIVVDILK